MVDGLCGLGEPVFMLYLCVTDRHSNATPASTTNYNIKATPETTRYENALRELKDFYLLVFRLLSC